MIDVRLPTTDGNKVIMPRYTQPEPELKILLQRLHGSPSPNNPLSAWSPKQI